MRKFLARSENIILLVGFFCLLVFSLQTNLVSHADSSTSTATVKLGKSITPAKPASPEQQGQEQHHQPNIADKKANPNAGTKGKNETNNANNPNDGTQRKITQTEKEPPMVKVKGQNGQLPQTGQMFAWGTTIVGILLIFLAIAIIVNRQFIKKLESKSEK